jgi:uncharacterized protein
MSLLSQYLYIAPSPLGGRGVFTARKILAGEPVEICPVIVLKVGDVEHLDKTVLYDYYFLWEDEDKPETKTCAMALGFGSLYNHIAPSNADYEMDFEEQTIKIFAVRDIPAGAEIMINYNGDPEDATPPWFMETKE